MAQTDILVVWFKRDLRIHDHAPLSNAAAGPVLPVFAIEPGQWQAPDSALRHWQFAADSLVDLAKALETRGLPLCLWQGDILDLLAALEAHYGDFTLHSHEETGNAWSFARDLKVKAWCRAHHTPWHEARQHGVVRGLASRVADRGAWEAQWEALMTAPTVAAPHNAQAAPGWEAFHHIEVSKLYDLALGFDTTPCPERQPGGRYAGRALWHGFLTQRGRRYRGSISKPLLAWEFGSRLSPHLAWGTLSMREVVRSLAERLANHMAGHATPQDLPLSFPPALCITAGSRDPITLAQINALLSAKNDVVHIPAPNGYLDAEPQQNAHITVLQATPGAASIPAATVATNLAASLKKLTPANDVTWFLTGGATAEAVLLSNDILEMQILGEILPGLPVCRTDNTVFITKSGGFGADDTLTRVAEMIY